MKLFKPVRLFCFPSTAVAIGLAMIVCGCQSEEARIPRPRAYPRIAFPERNYVDFQQEECPLTFRYPDYMKAVRRKNFFDEKPAHDCWFDLQAPALGATLHCSYAEITSPEGFTSLVSDAFRIADQINQRASYMDELRVANAQGVTGLLMEFQGSAASPLHLYLTDSTAHFFRAALYFQSKVIPDSLAPVTDFLKEDIAELINSLQFTE